MNVMKNKRGAQGMNTKDSYRFDAHIPHDERVAALANVHVGHDHF
jgi:hypothetical protein